MIPKPRAERRGGDRVVSMAEAGNSARVRSGVAGIERGKLRNTLAAPRFDCRAFSRSESLAGRNVARAAASGRDGITGRLRGMGAQEEEGVERAQLVELRREALAALQSEERVPHLLEHGAKRRFPRYEDVIVAPALAHHRTDERSSQRREFLRLDPGGFESTDLAEEALELHGAQLEELFVARLLSVDQRGIHVAPHRPQLAQLAASCFERMKCAHGRPELAHRTRERLSPRAFGKLMVVRNGSLELAGIRDG